LKDISAINVYFARTTRRESRSSASTRGQIELKEKDLGERLCATLVTFA
jgi:hypothetical protein